MKRVFAGRGAAVYGLLAVLVVSGGGSVFGADQTWLDANPNNEWSASAANWDSGVWVDGNNAIFSGTGETLDVNGVVSVVNITFSVTGYVVGDAGADGTLTLSGVPSVVTVASGTTNTISEVLAGTGGLTKAGGGELRLTGANSGSTGNTIVNVGTLRFGGIDALPAGTVTVSDGATLEWAVGNDPLNARSVTASGTGVGGRGALVNNTGGQANNRTMVPLILAGNTLVVNKFRTDPYNADLGGHRLTKRGLGSWNMRGSFASGAGGAVTVDEGLVQIEICNSNIQTVDGGIVVNAGAYFALLSYNGPTHASCVDADIVLNDAGLVGTSYNSQTGIPDARFYGTVTLNGDCAIQVAWSDAAPVNDETKRDTWVNVYSELGGSGNLTINPAAMSLAGTISYPVVLYATNTFTGNLAIEKGTLVLAPTGAVTNSPQVLVASGATLVVSNTVDALGDDATLIVADDGNNATGVTLDAGVDDTVSLLVLGGAVQTTLGTYGSTASGATVQNDEYFSGAGVVRLVSGPPTMTWRDGNANNDWDTTQPNWDAGVVWLQAGSAIFDGTGEAVELETGISVKDMTFNVDGYSIKDVDADGSLTLISSPSVITVVNAGHAVVVADAIEGSGGLTKSGDGRLTLSGGDSPATGNTLVGAGLLYWGADDALPSGSVTVESGATVDLGLMAHLAKNSRAYTIAGTGTAGQGALIKTAGAGVMGTWGVNGLTLTDDATIGGSQRFDLGNYIDLNGFVLTKEGNNGVPFRTDDIRDSSGGVVINQGHMYMENLDITIDGPVVVNSGGTLGAYVTRDTTRTFDVPVTLNAGGRLWAAGWHNNITPQTAGTSVFSAPIALSGTVYMYTGYNGSAGVTPGDMVLTEVVSGTGILVLNDTATGVGAAADHTIEFAADNTYAGAVRIERGRLLVSAGGALNACTAVEVASGAIVEVQNTGGALSDTAALSIVNDGNTASGVTLAAGVDDTVGSLLLGGVLQTTIGSYGSTTSGADVQSDEYFSGDGVVRIVGLPADMTWIDANANNDWSLTVPNWDAGVGWVQNASAVFGGTGESVELEAAVMVGNMTFNAAGYSIDDADGDGGLTLAGSPSVLTVTDAGATTTVSKAIDGSGGVTKAGDGTLVLNGTNSTSTGDTIVSAGKVQWGATDALPSGSVTVEDGATLEWTTAVSSPANQRSYTISGDGVDGRGAVYNRNQNHGGNLCSSLALSANATVGNDWRMDIWGVDTAGHTLTKDGVGNFNIRAMPASTCQRLVVNEGLAQFEGLNGIVLDGITVNAGAYFSVLANDTDRTLDAGVALNGGGLVATWYNGSPTNVTVSFLKPITVTGACKLQIGINDPVVVDETNGQVDMDVLSAISGGGNLTINPGGGLSNPGGRLVRLLADNSGLTGTLTIDSGNVYIDYQGANTGTLNDGPLVVNGTLWLDRSDDHTITDTISGTGRTIVRYDGDVTFDGNTVNHGYIDVANGSLTLQNGADVTLVHEITVGTGQRQPEDLTIAAELNIPAGCSLSAAGIVCGNDPGNLATTLAATINQTGGTVDTSGDVGEGCGLRLAHYPHANNVYNMSGGTLTIGGGYDLCPATDGTGWFNMTGGDVFTTRVMMNERNNAAGSGRVTLSGGTLHVGGGGITVDSPGPYTLELGGAGGMIVALADFEQTVNAALYGSGAAAVTYDSDGHAITVSGILSGSGALVKDGAGTLALTAVNNYSGRTLVNGGTLSLTGGGSLVASTDVEIGAGGTLEIQNTGGALSRVATLTIADDADGGTGVTLGTGVDETVYVLVLGGVAQTEEGTYGSSASGADHPFDEYFSGDGVVRLSSGYHWDGTDTTADADGGNGAWDTTTANWDDAATGGSGVTWNNAAPMVATFGGAAGVVEVDAAVVAAGLSFSTGGYTLADGDANGTLSFIGSPALSVGTGLDATISEALTGTGGFIKSGAGRLKLATANNATMSGQVIVSAGTLYWDANDALPSTPSSSSPIMVLEGATVDLGSLTQVNNARHYAIAGAGVGGAGAMVKTAGVPIMGGFATSSFKLLGDATVGGTVRFDIAGVNLNGFKLSKVGYNAIPVRNAPAINTSGGLDINQGCVYFESIDQVMDGPITVGSGAYLGVYPYGAIARSMTADIVLNDGRMFVGSNTNGADVMWYGSVTVNGAGSILCGATDPPNYLPGATPGDMHMHSAVSGSGELYINRAAITPVTASAREVCFYADNPFEGNVHVERGACRLLAGGTFSRAAQVALSAGATLDIENTGNALNDDGELVVPNDTDSGTGVYLAAGVQEEVRSLVLGGVTYGRGDGTFGSSDSAANHKDNEFFSGPGLIVMAQETGTLFLIR